MSDDSALHEELATISNLLKAVSNAQDDAEALAHEENEDRLKSRIHDLGSQALSLKRVVRSLPRFDRIIDRIEHKRVVMRLPSPLQERFEQELEDARRNEHRALTELHAVAVVLHDLSRRAPDRRIITAAAHKLYAELSRLRAILEAIKTDVNGELILFDGA